MGGSDASALSFGSALRRGVDRRDLFAAGASVAYRPSAWGKPSARLGGGVAVAYGAAANGRRGKVEVGGVVEVAGVGGRAGAGLGRATAAA